MTIKKTGIDILFPGEELLASTGANLIVSPKEFGLKKLAFGNWLWLVGMKDKEALGGRVYLTNYRLIFKTHRLNRLRGSVSVFLPTIEEVNNSSYLMMRKMTVKTASTKVSLVIRGVDRFIGLINKQKSQLNQVSVEEIQQLVTESPDKCGNQLASWNSGNIVNKVLSIGGRVEEGVQLFTNPLEALGGAYIKELLDRTIAEKWQKKFDD